MANGQSNNYYDFNRNSYHMNSRNIQRGFVPPMAQHNYYHHHRYQGQFYPPTEMHQYHQMHSSVPSQSNYQYTSEMIYNIEPISITAAMMLYDTVNEQPHTLSDFMTSVEDFISIPSHQSQQERMEGPLITSDQIMDPDVLCGRGAGANTHTGNTAFRSMIGKYQHTYFMAKAVDKAKISKGIVADVYQKGGRFLKRSVNQGEKTCQALRERGPSAFDLPQLNHHNNQVTLDTSDLRLSLSPLTNNNNLTMDDFGVSDKDILLGRGGVTNSHIGNKNFRTLVRQSQREYLVAAKLDKANIAMDIVKEVISSGGRFLHEKGDRWVEVTPEKAREKTSQALREKAPELRKLYETNGNVVATSEETDAAKKRKYSTEESTNNSFVLSKRRHLT
jgi:hypothetical protein